MTAKEREELEQLRKQVELCSLGDRPHSPAVATLRRLFELEAFERGSRCATCGGPAPDPGHRWARCCCSEIDPRNRPCVVCERRGRAEPCPTCVASTELEARGR